MERRFNLTAYAVLAVALIGLWLLIQTLGVTFASPAQAVLFTIPGLAGALVIGFLNARDLHTSGFPLIWDSAIPIMRRLVIPTGIGILFGGWGILNSLLTGGTPGAGLPLVAFPASIPYYLYGNSITEVLFRLGLLVMLMQFLKPRLGERAWLWSSLIMAVLEAGAAVLGLMSMGGAITLSTLLGVVYFFVLSFVLSLLHFRGGFVAPLIARNVLGLIAEVLVPLL